MSDPLLHYLLTDDAPAPPELAEFAELELPPELEARTLSAVSAERTGAPAPANNNRSYLRALFLAGLGLAAAALLVVRSAPETGDLSEMTPRGLAETSPGVSLKMAALHDGELERLRQDREYAAGDELYFRYQTDRPAWLYLVHANERGLQVLTGYQVDAGEADLSDKGQKIYWLLEEGDRSASFALVSSDEQLDFAGLADELEAQLIPGQTVSPEQLCNAAAAIGRQCDAAWVEVSP